MAWHVHYKYNAKYMTSACFSCVGAGGMHMHNMCVAATTWPI